MAPMEEARIVIDAYDALDVGLDATEEEIKKAYKRMSLQLHPDKIALKSKSGTTSQAAKEAANSAFTELKDAYDILSDVDRRRNYDRFGIDLHSEGNPQNSVWNIGCSAILQPVAQCLLKTTIVGIINYLLSWTWIFYFTLLSTLLILCLLVWKTSGKTLKFSELTEELQADQIGTFYCGVAIMFLGLQAVFGWFADSLVVSLLFLETFGLGTATRSRLGGLFASSVFLSWLLQNLWFNLFLLGYGLAFLLLLAVLLGTVLIHLWLDSLDLYFKQQVRTHRESMRKLKSRSGSLARDPTLPSVPHVPQPQKPAILQKGFSQSSSSSSRK